MISAVTRNTHTHVCADGRVYACAHTYFSLVFEGDAFEDRVEDGIGLCLVIRTLQHAVQRVVHCSAVVGQSKASEWGHAHGCWGT
jgi:hypothetical protein